MEPRDRKNKKKKKTKSAQTRLVPHPKGGSFWQLNNLGFRSHSNLLGTIVLAVSYSGLQKTER